MDRESAEKGSGSGRMGKMVETAAFQIELGWPPRGGLFNLRG
jgi:hypothetical protein